MVVVIAGPVRRASCRVCHNLAHFVASVIMISAIITLFDGNSVREIASPRAARVIGVRNSSNEFMGVYPGFRVIVRFIICWSIVLDGHSVVNYWAVHDSVSTPMRTQTIHIIRTLKLDSNCCIHEFFAFTGASKDTIQIGDVAIVVV